MSWYDQGLNFSCQPDCGACCKRGEHGTELYLSSEDAIALAEHLNTPLEQFLETFVAIEDEHLVLAIKGDACPFLENNRCTVYPARPTQCQTFPFWPRFLENKSSWEGLKAYCPGIGQGERRSSTEIKLKIQQHRAAGHEE